MSVRLAAALLAALATTAPHIAAQQRTTPRSTQPAATYDRLPRASRLATTWAPAAT